ncbi:MAG TPA: GNAT family N-acetyltransferase [Acidobacteriaceae bacterium]
MNEEHSASGAVCVREGRPDDVDAVIALERATEFAPHWPRAAYAEAIQAQAGLLPRRVLVAERIFEGCDAQRRLVGFAVMAVHDGSAELESVAVAVAERRAGTGMALCKAALAWACRSRALEVTIEVRAQSRGAIALYRRLGFVETARRPRYYAGPEDDAVLMRLPLIPSSIA